MAIAGENMARKISLEPNIPGDKSFLLSHLNLTDVFILSYYIYIYIHT